MTEIYTIGHSSRTIEEFIKILNHYEIKKVVDVRSLPGSNYAPQFNKEVLKISLENAHISYNYMQGLGGFRPTYYNSINTGWKNKSFRGYADYMLTDDFKKNLDKLIDITSDTCSAIMCAEVLPWRCHRSLIADALVIRGYQVFNIISENNCTQHRLTEFAHVEPDNRITYPFRLPLF